MVAQLRLGEMDLGLSIVAPAYNEEENLSIFLPQCRSVCSSLGLPFEIVIVDDGSRDATRATIEEKAKEIPQIKLVVHEENKGYAASLRDGFKAASKPLIAFIDTDLAYDIEDLPRFVAKMKEDPDLDAVIGYRVHREDSLVRKLVSRGYVVLTDILFISRFKDTQCMYRLFRREILDGVSIDAKGFEIPTELTLKWHVMRRKMVFVPVIQHHRKAGRSSFKVIKNIYAGLIFLLRLWMKIMAYKLRIKTHL